MNTAERLSELALDFQRQSTAKHQAAGMKGDATIVPVHGGEYGYVILYRDGTLHGRGNQNGSTIGRTRVQAIRWLLQHRRTWGNS